MSSICLQFLGHLADTSIRALCLGGLAWLVMFAGRVLGPAVRHAMWSAVLAGMLSLPLLIILLPSLPIGVAALHVPQPLRFEFMGSGGNARVASKFGAVPPAMPLPPTPRWPVILTGIYLLVALAWLGRFYYGYRKSRRLYMPSATPDRSFSFLCHCHEGQTGIPAAEPDQAACLVAS